MSGLEPMLLLSLAGTAVSAVGAIRQGNAEASAANTNAVVAQRNADISRQNAAADVQRENRLARLRAGANRAAAGASGGGIAGSALDLLEDNALEDALNIATIKQQGELKASGFETTAYMDKTRASSAKTRGMFNAGSQLLIGGSKTYELNKRQTPVRG